MCHYCGAKLAKSSNCTEQENGHSTDLNSGHLFLTCKLCGKTIYKDTATLENSSSCAMPPMSATASLKSIESSISNCSTDPLCFLPPFNSIFHYFLFVPSLIPSKISGDISVDANICER